MKKNEPELQVFQPLPGAGNPWHWHLRAPNGEIQCPSEPYPTKAHAARGARAAQKNMAQATVVYPKPKT